MKSPVDRSIQSSSFLLFIARFFQQIGRPFYFGIVYLYVIIILTANNHFPSLKSISFPSFYVSKKYFLPFLQQKKQLKTSKSKKTKKKKQKSSPVHYSRWRTYGTLFVNHALGVTRFFFASLFSPITVPLQIIGSVVGLLPKQPLIRFGLVLSMTCLILSATSLWIYDWIFKDLPSPEELRTHHPILTTKMYDRHGNELYSIFKEENRTLIKLSDLPPHVIQATLAIEDAHFYTHPGFSIKGIMRAVKKNLTQDKVEGGSTITQQLVKNTLLTPEKKFKRKLREVVLAIAVDAMYEKDQILEMYFNEIPYGGSTYGIEEASLRYFNKSAKDLTLAEAAFLAGIPAAPTTYSPFGSTPELAYARQQEVLRRMVEVSFITHEQAVEAMSQQLSFAENRVPIQAPHFVMYVRNILAEKYGEDMISQGGLEIYTTLDLGLQNKAQEIVTNEINDLKRYRISNGAALVTQPNTGEILAMVGSIDYFDIKNDGQVNLTYRLRQPGSSIKPLTYALALERGYTPSSTILDAPITYQIPGSKPYSPKNYDGKFHGNVTLRQALANSYNIPAVKLMAAVGINTLIDKGEAMGIDTWGDRSRFGLSLTLGGGEVYMTDMAELYGTFANYGNTIDLNPIILIKDHNGNIIYQNECVKDQSKCERTRNLDPRIAYQLTNILSDNSARSAAFGTNSVLNIPGQQVAVKTGTTNSQRDNWTIGYTSDRLVAVWVGNNDNSPMSYVASGITGASPIWNKIIRLGLSEESPHTFAEPENLKKVAVCVTTGTLSCAGCPQVREDFFIPGTEPTKACIPEQFKKKDDDKNTTGQLTGN